MSERQRMKFAREFLHSLQGLLSVLDSASTATPAVSCIAAVMMTRSSQHRMRHRARILDEGQLVALLLVVVSAEACLARPALHTT
jgi:hypothetical protein